MTSARTFLFLAAIALLAQMALVRAADQGIDLNEGRKWWAFQPVKDVAPPDVKRADWAKSPIDRFILAKLEEKKLAPAPAADKRTLLRRAYYDLIGLPPTPADLDAFVADESPDAFAKVVDRLLAMPEYGQRWARHWLDVVRYADSLDSRGMANEFDFAFAWRYRDWVVNALNADLPYDTFIKHQLVGDLEPGHEPGRLNKDALVATTVYVIGEWGAGDADKEKVLTDIVDDQIDLTGRAFLGLTLSCARCHDHKFDPISTQDYYGLAGVFFSSRILTEPGVKGGGAPIVRVPLMDQGEFEKRKADEERVAELTKEIDTFLDEQYAALGEQMLPQVDKYLAAAWEYASVQPAGGVAKAPVSRFAQERGLNGYALSQWLRFITPPKLNLFTNALKDVNNVSGIAAWRNPDGADTPVVLANSTGNDVELLPGLKLPKNSLTMHPSPTAGIAVAWKSLAAGRVRVSGTVTDAHNACGDGITWSVSRLGGTAAAGEVASGIIANGGSQTLDAGTGGKDLAALDVAAGEMIQLAILPKADHSCDTTLVELEVAQLDGDKRVWSLARDVVPDLLKANPHPDSYGNADVWHFHDMAGAAQAAFPAGSAVSKFKASLGGADADMNAVKAAAEEVRKTLDSVRGEVAKLKAAGKDAVAAVATPDVSLYQWLTAPRGAFWRGARTDDANLSEEARAELTDMRDEIASIQQTLKTPIQFANAMQEGGTPKTMFPGVQDVPVHIRGSYTKLGEVVPRRFPEVIAGPASQQSRIAQGSGRRELAEWIASPANPLTARVMANRIWQHHFGEGIVRTANNFGKLGTPPTHPDLLDYLAARFAKLGWSIKAMHREIMLSAAYQQSSIADPAAVKADPDNLLFGRANRRRLDAESFRDSLLAVSGKLDRSLGGPATPDLNIARRTLYVMTVRSDRATYRALFDAADAGAIVEKRIDSTVAPQAMFLLNNGFTVTQARFLGRRALQEQGDDAARIRWMYRTLFLREPTEREVELGKTVLAQVGEARPGETNVTPELRWEAYAQVLLCTNEFMYVD